MNMKYTITVLKLELCALRLKLKYPWVVEYNMLMRVMTVIDCSNAFTFLLTIYWIS